MAEQSREFAIVYSAGNATIMVTDINGKNIKTVQLSAMGSGQISLQTSQLMSGTYTYSLYVDGNLIDTKKMILAK
jgi:trimeric autotransporter adhesin